MGAIFMNEYERMRVYIVAKTYPTISKEYSELVCTAGVLVDGSWVRMYPVPFRQMDDGQKYPKYSWVEVDLAKNPKDFRTESYRPNLATLRLEVPANDTKKQSKIDWDARREILFNNKKIYTNLAEVISDAHRKLPDTTSLAVFKPTEFLRLTHKETERTWNPDTLRHLKAKAAQLDFFSSPEEHARNYLKIATKIPYQFRYEFKDDKGQRASLLIEDWELGALFFKYIYDEKKAIEKVQEKYWDWMMTRDVYLILGTTLKHHWVSKNPFMIIGVFYPPVVTSRQLRFSLDC